MLVAAAAGRLAGERSAETITGYEVSYRLPDGSVVDSGGGPAGSTAEAEERFDDSPAATVADQVRADIADLPASVTQLRVLRPKDAAVVLVLTVTDPDLMIGSVARIMDKIDHHYEGVYVELRNTSGVPLAIGFRAARVPMGGQYFRPECEALTGMAHGGPTSDQQASRPLPPCR